MRCISERVAIFLRSSEFELIPGPFCFPCIGLLTSVIFIFENKTIILVSSKQSLASCLQPANRKPGPKKEKTCHEYCILPLACCDWLISKWLVNLLFSCPDSKLHVIWIIFYSHQSYFLNVSSNSLFCRLDFVNLVLIKKGVLTWERTICITLVPCLI